MRRLHRKLKKRKKQEEVYAVGPERLRVFAPVMLSLHSTEDHQNLMEFISSIFENLRPKIVLVLDFRQTNKIFVDAALVFMANLDKAIKRSEGSTIIKIAPSAKRSMNGVLTQIGVLNLCNQNFHIDPADYGVVDWLGLSGNAANKFNPVEIYKFLENVIKKPPPDILFKAVKEALLNIKHHAYGDSGVGTWWLLAHKHKQNYLIVVCDAGVGIPESLYTGTEEHHLRARRYLSKLANKINRPAKDSECIRASMKIGQSRTGDGHRGKGLPEMMNVVERIDNDEVALNIYSSSGRFTKLGLVKKPILHEYANSMYGTLVMWKTPENIGEIIES